VTTPPSKGLVVELYLIYFGLAQSFVANNNYDLKISTRHEAIQRSYTC
jgi:hypothetical protein